MRVGNNNKVDKSIIDYAILNFDMHDRQTEELRPHIITLEHIVPQSIVDPALVIKRGLIGNLLPLDRTINGGVNIAPFLQKKIEFERSDLVTVK